MPAALLAQTDVSGFVSPIELRLLILAFLVLAGPVIAEKVRVPGLVGLILLGMAFGPFVLGLLVDDGLVAVVGAVGLLYLMFLAGIELDINTFIANRRASITFGLMTFAVPFGLSFWVGNSFLGYPLAAAALMGAMWASHTLVAYTEVKAAGLESNRAIGAAVSATVITDVLALLILGFATASADTVEVSSGHSDIGIMPVWIGVFVLAGFCLWVLPKATQWFFLNVGRTRTQRFMWVFGGMAAGAFVSLLGGIEGLVGAFLAGIGINRQVPAHGPLMERIEFFGAALFVPTFLVSVGMSIDPRALTQGSTITLALVFTLVVVVGKVGAAVLAGLIFKFAWSEVGMMASLTIGQAAATLAIAQVGVSGGIFEQEVLNAAVLTVVLTVLITSIGTRIFARRLEPPAADGAAIGSHVLLEVPITGVPSGVIEVGVAITRKDDGLLTPYVVCEGEDCEARGRVLEDVVQAAVDNGQDSEGATRVDSSEVEGTINLARESNASLLLLPWKGPTLTGNVFFGDAIDQIGGRSHVPVAAVRMTGEEWNRIVYFQGRVRGLRVRREDSEMALDIARRIATHTGHELVVYATNPDEVEDPDQYSAVHRYDARSPRSLSQIAAGDLVVAPAHAVRDAMGVGLLRLAKYLDKASLLVAAGPGRLLVSTRAHPDGVFGIAAVNRRDRELLSNSWQG